MASITKVGDKWRAQVRRKGHPTQTATFSTRTLASAWARKTETELEAQRAGLTPAGITGAPLSEIFDKALADPTIGRTKRNVLEHLRKGLGAVLVDQLSPTDIIAYITAQSYSPATAQQELSILGTTLKLAELAWGYLVPPAAMQRARATLKMAGKVGASKSRDRRPTADELERLCAYFDVHSTMPFRDILWFAVWTAMRASEITALRWEDYNSVDKTIVVRNRKHPMKKIGNDQVVPLLDEAIEIIERQPRTAEQIFPYKSHTFSSLFPRACQLVEPRIRDLRLHDLRHEGTSRLFERGYQIHEVAMFTGHRDWRQLKRYTQLRARDLRRLPLAA